MRSLSSTLLTNQESDSANPYVTVDIGGGSSETYGATTIDDNIVTYGEGISNICRDSNGNLFVFVRDGTQLVMYKSTDGGDTWDGGTNIYNATDPYYFKMIIDSSDYLHLIWAENKATDEIYYIKIAASDYSVSVSAEKVMEFGLYLGNIGFTFDSNDIPHITIVTYFTGGA